MLPQQILAIVVSIRRAHHAMNVLLSWFCGISAELSQICRLLVIKFNQNHRTLDAVIKDTLGLSPTDPGKPGFIQVPVHLVHLYPGMSIIHVADIELNQIAKVLACRSRKIVSLQSSVFDYDVIFERLGKIIVAGLGEVQDSLFALCFGQHTNHLQAAILLLLQNLQALVFAGQGLSLAQSRRIMASSPFGLLAESN